MYDGYGGMQNNFSWQKKYSNFLLSILKVIEKTIETAYMVSLLGEFEKITLYYYLIIIIAILFFDTLSFFSIFYCAVVLNCYVMYYHLLHYIGRIN